jgi:hypothetical protein
MKMLLVAFIGLLVSAQANAMLVVSIDSLYTAASPDAIAVDQAPAGTATALGNSTVADDSPGAGFVQKSSTTADAFPFLYTLSGQLTASPKGLAVFGSFENLLSIPVTMAIRVTATDIVSDGNVLVGELISTIVGAGGTVTASGFIDPLNRQFGIGGSVLESVMLTAPVGAGLSSSIASDLFAPSQTIYSVTNDLNLTLGPQGRAFVNFFIYTEAQAVPEPATSSLLALGLLALAFGHRKARARLPEQRLAS